MPQLNKGGKYVFGLSVINGENKIQIPDETLLKYSLTGERKIIIFTGSKITGGFCVTAKNLLMNSKLKHILDDCPALSQYKLNEGEFIRYKGRGYAWVSITPTGIIQLTDSVMQYLSLSVGDTLMSIKSSDIAFTMGLKGPLMDKVHSYMGEIETYRVSP